MFPSRSHQASVVDALETNSSDMLAEKVDTRSDREHRSQRGFPLVQLSSETSFNGLPL